MKKKITFREFFASKPRKGSTRLAGKFRPKDDDQASPFASRGNPTFAKPTKK